MEHKQIIKGILALGVCVIIGLLWWNLHQASQQQIQEIVEVEDITESVLVTERMWPENFLDDELVFGIDDQQLIVGWGGPQELVAYAVELIDGKCPYTINWGDGSNVSNVHADCRNALRHTYKNSGTYDVTVTLFRTIEPSGLVRSWSQTKTISVGIADLSGQE